LAAYQSTYITQISAGPADLVAPKWTNSKYNGFKQLLNHKVWILTRRPNAT